MGKGGHFYYGIVKLESILPLKYYMASDKSDRDSR